MNRSSCRLGETESSGILSSSVIEVAENSYSSEHALLRLDTKQRVPMRLATYSLMVPIYARHRQVHFTLNLSFSVTITDVPFEVVCRRDICTDASHICLFQNMFRGHSCHLKIISLYLPGSVRHCNSIRDVSSASLFFAGMPSTLPFEIDTHFYHTSLNPQY